MCYTISFTTERQYDLINYMEYKPENSKVLRVWNRLSPETREARLSQAMERLELVNALEERDRNESERAASVRLNAGVNRTTIRNWRERYNELGFDGLIDIRIGPYSRLPENIQNTICILRRMDPDINVERIISLVKEHHDFKTGATTVKRVLRENGLNRKRGTQKGKIPSAVDQRLEFGGMKLLEVACIETGYAKALTTGISSHVKDLPRPEVSVEPDKSGRDKYGRILPNYNKRYRKKAEDPIGPGFASVSEKRQNIDPARMDVFNAKESTIESKLLGLMGSPLIGNGRWDGMRAANADSFLKEVCGYPYMPATLDKFTRELKYAGVASTLWEIHARFWLSETSKWGDQRRAAVIYADGTPKPVWTSLFSQSTKVSNVGRIMPGLDVVAFHSGYGVPLWMLTHSGRAPLVKVLPDALNRFDEICSPYSASQILVIDAEGNSIPFVKSLEQGDPGRAWMMRLRDNWVNGKKIFNRINYRPWRNGDRVRSGLADFNDPDAPDGKKFRMRVVEVERRTSQKIIYLGASSLLHENEWKPQDLADLYFDRWPLQEANFRAVNQAAGFKSVHGYGKQLVDNISVINKLDELSKKTVNAEELLIRQQSDMDACEKKVREENKILNRKIRRQGTVKNHIESKMKSGKTVTQSLQGLVKEQHELIDEVTLKKEQVLKCQDRYDKTKPKHDNTQARLDGYRKEKEKLQSRRKILAHDVELDSIFNLLKVALVLMITYVLREYLGNAHMDALTFLERLATLPARLRMTPDLEIVTFKYNKRDPDVMALLEKYCETINSRGLRTRSNRKLRIQVDPPPKRDIPPPDRSRCKSNGRFFS